MITSASANAFIGTAANDNFTDDELPTSIPPDKAAMRSELERATADKPVTVCKPHQPRTTAKPFKLGPVANDNTPQSWPLAEALRRAGREADIDVCEVYRGLWSVMSADPLQGRDPNMSNKDEEPAIHTESRGGLDGYEAFKETGEVTGTGEIEYHGVRQTARSPGISSKAVRKGDSDAGDRYRPTVARFNEDTLITQIDMRNAWNRLRAAIRPVLSPFEDACLDAATLTEIGEAQGFTGKQASSAAKALVFAAIDALRDEWGEIRREMRALEDQAECNVIQFRARLARRDAEFLGRAA